MTDARRSPPTGAWVWGGGLLLASVLLQVLLSGSLSSGAPGLGDVVLWLGILSHSAALLVFAFGWRGGSVTAGRPVPTTALVLLALWGPLDAVLSRVIVITPEASDEGVILGSVQIAIWLGAALVAAIGIQRAGVVPRPWHRAPLWGLAIVAGTGVLTQVAAVALGQRSMDVLILLFSLSGLVTIAVPLLLGILAIVLGLRDERPAQVQVYPPAS